jgi:uncharacterized protein (DUF1501 family)
MLIRTDCNCSRRRFLKGAALGAAAVAINPILSLRSSAGAAEGIPGKFMVVINMLGGCDGLNVVIPTHLTPYVTRRANINLVNEEGSGGGRPVGETLHDLDGRFALHYDLNNVKQMWDDNDLHIVNKVSYPNPNQSHFTSQDIYSFGIRDNFTDGDGRGWLGRFADEYCTDPVEPLGVISVGLGKRPDFNAETTNPLILNNVAGFTVDPDREYGNTDFPLREATMRDILASEPNPLSDPGFTIFDTNRQAYELVDRVKAGVGDFDPGLQNTGGLYPNTTLGRNLRTISQLLAGLSSFGTKVFYTGFGGHDTHSAQIARQSNLMTQLDESLGAFAGDLKSRNLWDDVVIVVISEFGRRIFENGSVGTDHGWGNAFLVMGGPVKGRLDAGSGLTSEVVEADLVDGNNQLPFQVDFRDIYSNITSGHMGVAGGNVLFPDPGYQPDPSGLGLV